MLSISLFFGIGLLDVCGLHLRNSLYASRTSGSSGCERKGRQEIATHIHFDMNGSAQPFGC